MSTIVSVPEVFGAILLGSLLACAVSGIVAVQVFTYYRMYPDDTRSGKATVLGVWILDLLHTAFITAATWTYFVDHFGDVPYGDVIPWSIPITVILTASSTFVVQCFFAHRLHKLSHGKWWIAPLVVGLSLLRLGCACTSGAKMLTLKSFDAFYDDCGWVFTVGLSTSSGVDVIVTGLLCYFLRSTRRGCISMRKVLDTLMLYAIENGTATCIATIMSLIFWLRMPYNRIFLGLHFVISKLYANSLLATLNARQGLREESSNGPSEWERRFPVLLRMTNNSTTERHWTAHVGRGSKPDEGYGPDASTPNAEVELAAKDALRSGEASPTTWGKHELSSMDRSGPRVQINVSKSVVKHVDDAVNF